MGQYLARWSYWGAKGNSLFERLKVACNLSSTTKEQAQPYLSHEDLEPGGKTTWGGWGVVAAYLVNKATKKRSKIKTYKKTSRPRGKEGIGCHLIENTVVCTQIEDCSSQKDAATDSGD